MGSRWLTAVLCALTLSAAWGALPADAAAKNKNLVKARKAYEDLDYTKAQSLLQKALKQQTTFDEQIEIYELLATVHAIYGRDEQAQQAFFEVLKRNPDAELPADTSPKIKAAFANAREAWKADGSPRITVVASADEGTAKGGVADLGDTEEEAKPETPTPPAPSPTPAVSGQPPATGQPPVTTVVEPVNPLMSGASTYERREPVYKKWWFWTIVGVVVAGGGGAAVWYFTQPQAPAHDFGPIPIQ